MTSSTGIRFISDLENGKETCQIGKVLLVLRTLGLLPEEANRALIAKSFGISKNNDFALLDRIGGECAGAVANRQANPHATPSCGCKTCSKKYARGSGLGAAS